METARGIEYGRVVSAPKEVDDDSVVQPLKSVIRIATEQDEKTVEKNRQKEKEAFKICQEKIRKHGLDMKLNILSIIIKSCFILQRTDVLISVNL